VDWRVKAIRGATTTEENTVEAIASAVGELLDELEQHNHLDPQEIISVVFTTTPDLDAIFPAAIARQRPHWDDVALLDMQQMLVPGSIERCIRCLVHFNTPNPHTKLYHPYLRRASHLRPDRAVDNLTFRELSKS